MKLRSRVGVAFLALITGIFSYVQEIKNAVSLDAIPQDLEVKVALSALPPYLRADATVYVLDPANGYQLERKGSNGFSCFVERTDWVRADFRKDLFVPECFDAEGTKTIVPVSFDVARLRAEGKLTAQQLKDEIARRFKEGVYRSPSRPGISYMLSPFQRLYGGPGSLETRIVHFGTFVVLSSKASDLLLAIALGREHTKQGHSNAAPTPHCQ